MASINALSPLVINKIAAGEVIENPASVVKEILENAVDAGATEITVRIAGGGMDLISIEDDGNGIPKDELLLAIGRHYTSKLREFEDLEHIGTLGFRGEALASIAAVAHLTLQSRPEGQEAGAQLEVVAGNPSTVKSTSLRKGTIITVEQLFFSTPVRRKFLKSVGSEQRRITQLITTYALSHPHIGFTYVIDGETKIHCASGQDFLSRVLALLGKEVAGELISIDSERSIMLEADRSVVMRLQGYIGKLPLARASRQWQYLFVNERPVVDFVLSHTVREAYGTLLDRQNHPAFFLFLTIPPELVDVNVHPRKTEVKFQPTLPLYSFIRESVGHALAKQDMTTSLSFSSPSGGFLQSPFYQTSEFRESSASYSAGGLSFDQQSFDSISASLSVTGNNLLSPEPLMQLFSSYILAQGNEGLFLIDQHAAQERILYESFSKAVDQHSLQVQDLILPDVFVVAPAEEELLREHQEVFLRLGFLFESFGEQQIALKSVPAFLVPYNTKESFQSIMDLLLQEKKIVPDRQLVDRVIMRACKASIKARDRLSFPEMKALIVDLYNCEQRYTCPHGRPTIISLDEKTMEKIFHRR
ncbi:MAG: DNA mismatch repair endonuclease MutL [bacterium]